MFVVYVHNVCCILNCVLWINQSPYAMPYQTAISCNIFFHCFMPPENEKKMEIHSGCHCWRFTFCFLPHIRERDVYKTKIWPDRNGNFKIDSNFVLSSSSVDGWVYIIHNSFIAVPERKKNWKWIQKITLLFLFGLLHTVPLKNCLQLKASAEE